jgi:S1-C subfamily serine protease
MVQPAPFSARALRAGDTVWVVGAPSPGDTAPWMSSGLVASTDSLVAVASGPTTSGLVETAAASTSGSTGGALVDHSGNVTGIVLSPVGDDRMTYAVPISTALSVAADLRTHGYAIHGALGINGVNNSDGPTVSSVIANGPAARGGVRVGDVIDSVDNHEVYSMDDVMAVVRHDRPGQAVELTLERGSSTVRVRVTLTGMISG